MHCSWLKIFGPNLAFISKTIIAPSLGKRNPNIQSSFFNVKVLILVKNTTPSCTVMKAKRGWTLVRANLSNFIYDNVGYKWTITLKISSKEFASWFWVGLLFSILIWSDAWASSRYEILRTRQAHAWNWYLLGSYSRIIGFMRATLRAIRLLLVIDFANF